jgi:hypothetical protein
MMMTLEEAREWARIIGYADGGCSHCVGELADAANEAFPDFVFVMGSYEDDERVTVTLKPSPASEAPATPEPQTR